MLLDVDQSHAPNPNYKVSCILGFVTSLTSSSLPGGCRTRGDKDYPLSIALSLLPSAVPPLPSLNPGPALEEGQGLTLAASCTAEGSPEPSVSWDTAVRGSASNRSFKHSRSAAVTSEFRLVPSRSMNQQPLTCVVSHPGLLQDQRITHILHVACKWRGKKAWRGKRWGPPQRS